MKPTPAATKFLQIAILFIAIYPVCTRASAENSLERRHTRQTGKHPSTAPATQHTPRRARPAKESGPLYATRPDVLDAAHALATRLNLEPRWVRRVIGQSRYLPAIARAITPPPVGTAKNWALYRSRFVEPNRIRAGVAFWQDNREVLERAQAQTGVPASIIVGILGVETMYGQQMGSFRVMDALTTLAFDFPKAHPRATERAAYFLSELEVFLAWTHHTGTDPLALRGSYAGAMGWPQFMPSSWNKYAVDFDGDGRTDLFHSAADVIGSVANYFVAHGWKPGMPTHYPVNLVAQGADRAALLAPDIRPTFAPTDMAAKGGALDATALQHPGPLALVELQNGNAPASYLAGTENFYAITRYNWSSYYALAVIELGQAVDSAMSK